ncbi:NAD-binding protein, partial [Chloroflexota bacterium]
LFGSGVDEEALKRAGIEKADVFIALTQGDNRNVLATQTAKHVFNVPRVICRIYDPLRQEMYSTLGIEAISPTTTFTSLLMERLENKEA